MMICVSIGRTRHNMVIREHRALAQKGAELVELRLDFLARPPDLPRLLNDRPTAVIVTCRTKGDRGRWKGTEEQRLALLRAAIAAEADYVDLEDDIAAAIPRYGPTKRIISRHNFDETPDDLEEIHARLCELDPDIVKLVTMANSPSDNVRMLKLIAGSSVPTVGICMGELGLPTRVLCGKYGSPLTFATFSKERQMGPGQLSFEEMHDLYRYPQIGSGTKVFGVLGDPIANNLSPLVYNTAFRDEGLSCVYVPFRVPKHALSSALDDFQWLGVQGYSVTVPLTEAVLAKADNRDGPAQEIGAANTLYRDRHDVWRAANTDYEAALASIRIGLESGPAGDTLQGKKVLMLGAGSIARTVGLGLARAGAALTIANRTHERAVTLAAKLACQQTLWENRGATYADILVNCTSVGMHPNVDDTPFPGNWLREGMLVFDTIYHPENTLLIKQAEARGCRTVSGVEMFVRQAAEQFECFTGQAAPLETMCETLRLGISPVSSW